MIRRSLASKGGSSTSCVTEGRLLAKAQFADQCNGDDTELCSQEEGMT